VREYVNIGGRFALGRENNEKTTNENDGKYKGMPTTQTILDRTAAP
jgi:hypothetical protein